MNQPDSKEIAKLLAGRLIERRDVKAIQFSKGYAPHVVDPKADTPEYLPVTLKDLIDHVEGRKSYGHYVVSTAGTCRMFAFDIDLEKQAKVLSPQMKLVDINPREIWAGPPCEWRKLLAKDLQQLTFALASQVKETLGLQVLVAYSGNKGMHVIGLLDPGTPAEDARLLAVEVLDQLGETVAVRGDNFFKCKAYPSLSIETFPKQEAIQQGGFGNLMRLPLGINLKSNKPAFFLDASELPNRAKVDDPLLALQKGSLR